MPTAFDTQFSSAFRSLLAHHGERVLYSPRNGPQRDITALVTRREIQEVDGFNGTILAPMVTLEALDDPTDEEYGGIDPSLANSGGDRVRLAWVQGGVQEDRAVSKRLPSDGGVVRLEIV